MLQMMSLAHPIEQLARKSVGDGGEGGGKMQEYIEEMRRILRYLSILPPSPSSLDQIKFICSKRSHKQTHTQMLARSHEQKKHSLVQPEGSPQTCAPERILQTLSHLGVAAIQQRSKHTPWVRLQGAVALLKQRNATRNLGL